MLPERAGFAGTPPSPPEPRVCWSEIARCQAGLRLHAPAQGKCVPVAPGVRGAGGCGPARHGSSDLAVLCPPAFPVPSETDVLDGAIGGTPGKEQVPGAASRSASVSPSHLASLGLPLRWPCPGLGRDLGQVGSGLQFETHTPGGGCWRNVLLLLSVVITRQSQSLDLMRREELQRDSRSLIGNCIG